MDGVGGVNRWGIAVAPLAVALAICAFPAVASAQQQLLPDLAPLPLDDKTVGDETIGVFQDPTGAVYLDVGFRNANFGAGPLELAQKPEPVDNSDPDNPADCDDDHNPDNDRVEIQNIYLDDNPSDGEFQRETETNKVSRPAGCSIFHVDHDHWHGAVMSTDLLTQDMSESFGQLPKLTFCLADYKPFDDTLPGFDSWPKGYEINFCNDSSLQGISIGWLDQYRVGTPGQLIDITGVPAGLYCVRQTVDSDDSIKELNDANNVTENPIYLNPAAATVDLLPGSCSGAPGPPVVDSTAPDTIFLDVPRPRLRSGGPSARAKFRFTSTEDDATFKCSVDAGPYKPCTSPVKLRLRAHRGSWTVHTFSARAHDAAGNADTSPAVWTGQAKRRARRG